MAFNNCGDYDKVFISDLTLSCIIGIDPHERVRKQPIIINITLCADLRKAGRSDDIEDTVNYRTLVDTITDVVEKSTFFLVERMAEVLADICLSCEGVAEVTVRIAKPNAIDTTRSVGVEIHRARK